MFGILMGIFVVFLIFCGVVITGFIPFICWAFAIVFWLSVTILVGGFIYGIIVGIVKKDFEEFSTAAVVAGGIFLCGIAICVVLYLLGVFVDFIRMFMSIFGMDTQEAITWDRAFFPWKY